MYSNKIIIQIGSHVGDTYNDPIFNKIDTTTKVILVEPVPKLFNQLRANYIKKFPNSSNIIFINKAVSNFVGEIILTIPSERNDFSRLPDWVSQLSSVIPTHITDHMDCILTDTIKVPTTTINEIIRENNIQEIELLHTDTEGHDYEILMNYDFVIKPNVVMFEHKHMDGCFKTGVRFNSLINRLCALGYQVVYSNIDDTVLNLFSTGNQFQDTK